MCPSFFLDMLNEWGGPKRSVHTAVQQTQSIKHFWLHLVIKDWIPIFAMFLHYFLEILCEVGGSNLLLQSALHIGQYSKKEV